MCQRCFESSEIMDTARTLEADGFFAYPFHCKLTFMPMDGLYFARSHGGRCDSALN